MQCCALHLSNRNQFVEATEHGGVVDSYLPAVGTVEVAVVLDAVENDDAASVAVAVPGVPTVIVSDTVDITDGWLAVVVVGGSVVVTVSSVPVVVVGGSVVVIVSPVPVVVVGGSVVVTVPPVPVVVVGGSVVVTVSPLPVVVLGNSVVVTVAARVAVTDVLQVSMQIAVLCVTIHYVLDTQNINIHWNQWWEHLIDLIRDTRIVRIV
jgi:hypothetical protein